MDLAWRIVVGFFLHGRDAAGEAGSLRCACDTDASSIVFQDDRAPLERSKYRVWARLFSAPVTQEHLDIVDKALANRDVLQLRQHLRGTIHRVCQQVRIVSQEANSAHSIHVSWFSGQVGTSAISRSCISAGPHASYERGLTMVVIVRPAVRQWLGHTALFWQNVDEDGTLWEQHGRALRSAVHGVETPRRAEFATTLGVTGLTPTCATPTVPVDLSTSRKSEESLSGATSGDTATMMLNGGSAGAAESKCVACEKVFPGSLIHTLSVCTHTVCLRCATSCAAHHAQKPGSTPTNMPCPAERCEAWLTGREVQSLISAEEFAVLEFNEVRTALADAVVCPSCTSMFDRELNDMPENDPLRDKFVCGACGTDFCTECGASPFHHGRGCRMVYGKETPTCRYCGNQAVHSVTATRSDDKGHHHHGSTAGGPSTATSVTWHHCDSETCVAHANNACNILKPCGHLCRGSHGERACPPCLEADCEAAPATRCGQDLCAICYVECLDEAPVLELACGHIFHRHCLEEKIAKRWPTARISFNFLDCPLCAAPIQHHLLSTAIQSAHKYRDSLEARFPERLKLERLEEHEGIVQESSPYYRDSLGWCRENFTYYECFKCHRPYFGGLKECQGADREEPNREELLCGGCSAGSATCPKHGGQYLEFKCKYCCNLAVWFCWGTTHFCDICHSPPRKTVRAECLGEELCPLGGRHLPNGQECAIGCALCRSQS